MITHNLSTITISKYYFIHLYTIYSTITINRLIVTKYYNCCLIFIILTTLNPKKTEIFSIIIGMAYCILIATPPLFTTRYKTPVFIAFKNDSFFGLATCDISSPTILFQLKNRSTSILLI
ncbi:hypothetical protein ECHJAX_0426 [Ehrlichia chaffeensis str. Jax]|nr:hypothetical protein ECHJAX_0426 [Ehrlichia chaffeensis str. Jax]